MLDVVERTVPIFVTTDLNTSLSEHFDRIILICNLASLTWCTPHPKGSSEPKKKRSPIAGLLIATRHRGLVIVGEEEERDTMAMAKY